MRHVFCWFLALLSYVGTVVAADDPFIGTRREQRCQRNLQVLQGPRIAFHVSSEQSLHRVS
jgi:hypothetical protein